MASTWLLKYAIAILQWTLCHNNGPSEIISVQSVWGFELESQNNWTLHFVPSLTSLTFFRSVTKSESLSVPICGMGTASESGRLCGTVKDCEGLLL